LVSIGGVILAREHRQEVSSRESSLGRYAIGAPRGHSGGTDRSAVRIDGRCVGTKCRMTAPCHAKPFDTPPFDAIVSELEYPMIVATVAADGERAGCLVGFSTQCSIDPSRYAVFISNRNRTADVAARARTMIVHFLRASDRGLAHLFGEETGDEISKFDRCSWRPGPDDTPVVDGCDWFAGVVLDRVDVGDHVLYLLDVTGDGDGAKAEEPQLGFQAVRGFEAGHHP
jgi:flavin reductase (DIM6/NTAB) family NADH-FMN oxidoreductase RutF